ncbi:trypsin-like serine protease [Pseudosulfitobacter sp. SM2401]|uniref:trypsin-like serine peptidase n=1 Tax=Pseudosulfitobacter sp. SM2401 TaxID=3350098 RepID=UPI0036F39D97
MMRFGLAVLLCLLGVTAQAQTTDLKRLGTENEALNWQAVGRLELAGRGFCTATLIAPDTVLTAAHCVYDSATGRAHGAENLVFRAGLREGQAAAVRGISKLVAHPGFDPNGPMNMQNVSHDVALLRLADPIPSSELNWFALHNDRVTTGPVSVVSYGKGRADAQSRQRECQMLERQNDVLAFDCDVTFGSSGAPVFSHLNGRGRVVSVISGMTMHNGKKIALGMYLPPLVAELKTILRTGSGPKPIARIRRLSVGSGNATTGAKFVKAPGS